MSIFSNNIKLGDFRMILTEFFYSILKKEKIIFAYNNKIKYNTGVIKKRRGKNEDNNSRCRSSWGIFVQ